MKQLKILYIEPQYSGSHKSILDGYKDQSHHLIIPLTADGKNWKETVVSGASVFANEINQKVEYQDADLIFATDLFDIGALRLLLKGPIKYKPKALMFLEHQLSWPADRTDYPKDPYLIGTNLSSAQVADHCYFNSEWALCSFLWELRHYTAKLQYQAIKDKCYIMPPGVDFKPFQKSNATKSTDVPIIVFPHRYECDKNPEEFLRALNVLAAEQIDFKIIITGVKQDEPLDSVVNELMLPIQDKIIHFGFVESREEMVNLMYKANIFVSTSLQEYFGLSAVEALYAGCYPIMPKRLSYPMFIPSQFQADHLYESFDDLVSKLRFALLNPNLLKQINYQDEAMKYDWIKVSKQWDTAFEGLIADGTQNAENRK